jgi:6-phosphogluconolactonase
VLVHHDAELLAQAAAARLVTKLVDVQAARGGAHVVLTGGTIGIRTLASLADSPARDAIDWSRLDIWWGDERFLPAGHGDRNETQARQALLDKLDLAPERVHAMPASDGPDGDDTAAAAARYADALAAAAHPDDHAAVPSFDVLLLGMGPDGHIASLFPEHAALYETERTVVGVHGSPKPPPTRISLTLPAIQAAREVWVIASGTEKAQATRLALGGAGHVQVPASGAIGRSRTLWLLDRAAASEIPPSLSRLSSP